MHNNENPKPLTFLQQLKSVTFNPNMVPMVLFGAWGGNLTTHIIQHITTGLCKPRFGPTALWGTLAGAVVLPAMVAGGVALSNLVRQNAR